MSDQATIAAFENSLIGTYLRSSLSVFEALSDDLTSAQWAGLLCLRQAMEALEAIENARVIEQPAAPSVSADTPSEGRDAFPDLRKLRLALEATWELGPLARHIGEMMRAEETDDPFARDTVVRSLAVRITTLAEVAMSALDPNDHGNPYAEMFRVVHSAAPPKAAPAGNPLAST